MQESLKNFVRTYLDFNFSLFFLKSKKLLTKYEQFFNTEVVNNPLTYRQRIAVILNEKRNLIVAGAGTGKTTTILAKVLYLIQSGECLEEEILLLAFTRSARDEMHKRLEDKALKKVKVTTIHALGLEIIRKVEGKNPRITNSLSSENNSLNAFITNLIKNLDKDDDLYSELALYFSEYLVPEKSEFDFNNGDEYLSWRNINSLVTLNGDWVKSYGELRIGNFLYANGIKHMYEEEYKAAIGEFDGFYRPDFYVTEKNTYIEYYGIDAKGNTAAWVNNEKYLNEIELKRNTHIEHGTNLIEITYQDFKDGSWQKKIRLSLDKYKIELKPISNYKIIEQAEKIRDGKTFNKFSKLLSQFLTLFKSKSLSIDKLIAENSKDKRTLIFLKIFKYIYLSYEEKLRQTKSIDFMDMLNKSTKNVKENKFIPKWKYIVVDEFQDTSYAQYEFLNNILAINEKTKLFCVGDDWQSIYAFTGSDYHYMTDYKEYFGVANMWTKITGRKQEATLIALDETFRFNNMISHTTSEFIQKNPAQIKKTLRSPTHLLTESESVFLYWVSGDTEKTIREWLHDNARKDIFNGKNLLILARYNFEFKNLNKIFRDFISSSWEGNGSVSYNTCHGSKGSEEDIVLILNVSADFLGFPSNVEDDPVLRLVKTVKEDEYHHAEERRLMYVAMTRARYQTHILCDSVVPSIFAKELAEKKYKTKVITKNSDLVLCPKCKKGYVINKTKNLLKKPFYQCSRAEVCNYVGTLCKCGSLLIRSDKDVKCSNKTCNEKCLACDKCFDGFLIKRESIEGEYSPFLGCTNYPSCKNTRQISRS